MGRWNQRAINVRCEVRLTTTRRGAATRQELETTAPHLTETRRQSAAEIPQNVDIRSATQSWFAFSQLQ